MVFSLSQLKEKKRELSVVVLNENLLRCEGRLQNASLTYDSKTPTLLNDKQKLAQLIVKNIHKCYKHIGLKHTSSELRQIFWIARGRNFVWGLVRNCLVCRRFEGKTYCYPITPPLTTSRLNDSRPFVTTGIDNFGPVYLKNTYGQSDKTFKV